MSRSGYTDDYDFDNWSMIRWRGVVASTIRGKRGQAFLRELVDALDAMPEKRLIAGHLATQDGAVCAIGSVGVKRGVDMTSLDPEDPDGIAGAFGISTPLVQEIEWMNDEAYCGLSDEGRWKFIREWAVGNLKSPTHDEDERSA